jgi:hypothetical protein
VIYWAWNNLLSVTQQYIIMTRNGAEIHLWKNLGVDKLMARFRPGGGSQGGGGASPARSSAAGAASVAPTTSSLAPPAPSSGDGVVAAKAAKAVMTREQALKTLGLAPGATSAQVEAAYKARARQNGSLNGSERLNQARDVLRGPQSS